MNTRVLRATPNSPINFVNDTYTIADGATASEGLFANKNITSVTFGKGLTKIGDYAFYGCKSLNTVTFAENSQLETIGASAFYNSAILTLVIPDSVKTIGKVAFVGENDFVILYDEIVVAIKTRLIHIYKKQKTF